MNVERKRKEILEKLNYSLELASPGAAIREDSTKRGNYYVITPSRRLFIVNPGVLASTMQSLIPLGEQALINTVKEANTTAGSINQMAASMNALAERIM